MERSCQISCKRNLPEASHRPPEGKGLYMQNIQARACSEQGGGWCYDVLVQKDITAGAKRKIKSGYKDTGRAAYDRTCCFSNETENESHFKIIFSRVLFQLSFKLTSGYSCQHFLYEIAPTQEILHS